MASNPLTSTGTTVTLTALLVATSAYSGSEAGGEGRADDTLTTPSLAWVK